MGFFESLSEQETAVILHRKADGTPHSVTVPDNFNTHDVENCLRSFGFTARLGEAVVYDEPELGRYITVPLLEVQAYEPVKSIAGEARKLVKQQLAGIGARLKGWAEKL